MTINSFLPIDTYTAANGDFQFSVSFVFEFGSDLAVYRTPAGDTPDDSDDKLIFGVDYTVQGEGFESPARFVNLSPSVFPTGTTEGDKIVIMMDMPFERDTDFQGAELNSEMLNNQLDRLTAMGQQIKMWIYRFGLKYQNTDFLVHNRGANILPDLPPHIGDDIPIWSTDSTGNLVATSIEENIDASTLRADLANADAGTDGAGLVGYYNTTTTTSETVRSSLNTLNAAVLAAALPTGFISFGFTPDAVAESAGWLRLQTGTIGNAASSATVRANNDTQDLFTYLWDLVDDSYCEVVGGRGASAAADFASNKAIFLPNSTGRVLRTVGQAVLNKNTFTADASTDILTISAPHAGVWFEWHQKVTVSSTGTLPNGLSPDTIYYVWINSATEIKLASSTINAINNVFVDITNAGTGVHTIQIAEDEIVAGEYFGSHEVLVDLNNLPPHSHTISLPNGNDVTSDSSGRPLYNRSTSGNFTTSLTGGAIAHNNMSPYLGVMAFIKL
jgi:hypothetical protein